MRKKIMVATLFVAFAVITGMNVYNAQLSYFELSGLALENVEALAIPEQPDVSDCKYDPFYACEALHPTDPSKDKYRDRARW